MKPKWIRVSLDEKEVDEVIEKAIELNTKIYKNIIESLKKSGEKRTKSELMKYTNTIFEKCGVPTYVLLKERLEEKCTKIREEKNDKKVFAV